MLKRIVIALAFLLSTSAGYAQVTVSGQVRTRTEYRDGLGTLRPKANSPAFFTSQRSRLTFNYKMNRVVLQASLQDVRLWGQDASTISNADGSRLGLHDAWAEIVLSNKKDSSFANSPVEYFSVRIGRQELLYDDSRLLGNLDWLQQARRHDAIIFGAIKKYLGNEVDWISSYMLNRFTQLELGLAMLAASRSMSYAKNTTPGTAKLHAQWGYLQVNIRPEFLVK